MITSQDFEKGADFTGLANPTAADHNNLVELATPKKDTTEEKGIGLILVTTDSALNTPVVPDASITTKWKRYPWYRRSFNGSVAPKHYFWDDNAVNDATYLKWVEVSTDTSSIEADVANAIATATNAETVAGSVATNANTAIAIANAATNTANNANTTANTAIANAAAAQSTANGAVTTANSAVVIANSTKSLPVALIPGTAYQIIRTKSDASAPEWFNPLDTYVRITQKIVKGTGGTGGFTVSPHTIVLNTAESNTGALVSLNAGTGKITFLVPGTYLVRAKSLFTITQSAAAGTAALQLLLRDDGAASTLLSGDCCYQRTAAGANTDQLGNQLEVSGIITVATNDVIKLAMYFALSNCTAFGGYSANVHPDVGGLEVFSSLELWLIGA